MTGPKSSGGPQPEEPATEPLRARAGRRWHQVTAGGSAGVSVAGQLLEEVALRRLERRAGTRRIADIPVGEGRRRLVVHGLKRTHALGVTLRLLGSFVGLIIALFVPVGAASFLLALGHACSVSHGMWRRLRDRFKKGATAGVLAFLTFLAVAGFEFIVFAVVLKLLGPVFLGVFLVLFVLFLAVTTWLSWWLDFEFITQNGQFGRTLGIWLTRSGCVVDLTDIRTVEPQGAWIAEVVTADTTAKLDEALHGFWTNHAQLWAGTVRTAKAIVIRDRTGLEPAQEEPLPGDEPPDDPWAEGWDRP